MTTKDTARVLGRAFSTDPVMTWLLAGRNDPGQRLTKVFQAFLNAASRVPDAQVLRDPQQRAAAIWLPPGHWAPGYLEQVRSLPLSVAAFGTGIMRATALLQRTVNAHPREPHWYLEAVGVVPEARGQGVGVPMLQPVLDCCDADGLPAYLESSNPRNISFYERHGFVVRPPFALPAGCPVITPMWRDPR